jgi:hypothetical protein
MQQWSLAAALNAPAIGAIKAWHGSPHKFTRFSDEAIGTGEGAQAFGMGHYSGENAKALDSTYRKGLIEEKGFDDPMETWVDKNKAMYDKLKNYMHNNVLETYPNAKVLTEPSLKRLQLQITNDTLKSMWYKFQEKNVLNEHTYDAIARQKFIDNANPELKDVFESIRDYKHIPNKGYLYELNLKPDPEDLLHFNKSLKEHPKAVYDKLKTALKSTNSEDVLKPEMTGRDAYNKISNNLDWTVDDAETSKLLKDVGIPGHAFPGQGGFGPSNYVMYDPNDIEIVRRITGGLDSKRKGIADYVRGKK